MLLSFFNLSLQPLVPFKPASSFSALSLPLSASSFFSLLTLLFSLSLSIYLSIWIISIGIWCDDWSFDFKKSVCDED
ncbi:hypothetical protein RIF29_35968 [Crotalaria pallida]|uniref:Uncharacterized protein n=1 Tax=Crotalaria pallida TaxID=3830 RepID=A0AAN9HUB8_CROPI